MENENASQVPSYSIEGIIKVLKDLNIKVTEKELKKPSPDAVANIYKELLSQFIHVKSELLNTDQQDLALNFNEEALKLQSESFRILQFYAIMRYWYELCGMNLTFFKIFNPTKPEFIKQMSGIISYCRFIFTELTDFQSVVDKTKAYTDECNIIKRDIDEFLAKLFSQNSELTQIKPIIDKCNARTSLLKEKIANAKEIKKKEREERDEFEKGEQIHDAEAKDINDKQQQISKKLNLYEKLIIRSPQRLNSDTEKNEARIIELEKLIVEITKEILNEKRNLFEREKFIDSSEKIFELIVNLYENNICNANNINKDIESIKEEIMNLSFDLEQKKSIDASLTAVLERVKEKTTTFHDQIGLEIENFKENITKLEEKIKLMNKELDELKLRKDLVSKQKIEQSRLSNEILNKALETVKYYQNMEYTYNVKCESMLEFEKEIKKAADTKYQLIGERMKQMTENLTKLAKENKENLQ